MGFVEVLLPIRSSKLFTYRAIEGLYPGDYVSVPVRRSVENGIVWRTNVSICDESNLKSVISKIDLDPCPPTMMKFIEEFARYNVCPAGFVVKSLLKGIGKLPQKNSAIRELLADYDVILNQEQEAAVKLITEVTDNFRTILIDGVTGSGKTETYMTAVRQVIRSGGQALILLPEILLASQLKSMLSQYGTDVTEWHSSSQGKSKALKAIISGSARIIVGARSALMLPYKNLKIIVVDEEHDAGYKQYSSFCYNARDMSILRAKYENIPVVLASATPSLETIQNIQDGKYQVARLTRGFHSSARPTVEVVDMKKEYMNISANLAQSICKALQNNDQIMLFLNRRGYCFLTICRSCGYKPSCINCSTWLVEHRYVKQYRCHFCDFRRPIDLYNVCPACRSLDSLKKFGSGVEQVHEEVTNLFPNARIFIMSSDTMRSRDSAESIMAKVLNREIDILIGTQIVAKGHNFPNLALIGIIDADSNGLDLRAGERTYQVLHQVSGRVGRFNIPGHIVIQTHCPDSLIINALKTFDRDSFYAFELESRQQVNMPPFSRLCCLTFSGSKPELVAQVASSAVSMLKVQDTCGILSIFGPSPSPVPYINKLYRHQVVVKVAKNIALSKIVNAVTSKIITTSGVAISIDMDPISFI